MLGRLLISALAVLALAVALPGNADALSPALKDTDQGKRVLLLKGPVHGPAVDRALRYIRSADFREVWLDSPGGAVEAAYTLGRALRERGAITRVPNGAVCASACVDVFVGGLVRFVDPGGRVIVHPGSIVNDKGTKITEKFVRRDKTEDVLYFYEQQATRETGRWARHLTYMGVSIDLIDFAAKVPHNCGITLSRRELLHFNVVNTQPAPANFTPRGRGQKCP